MKNDNKNLIILFSITFIYTLLIGILIQSYLIPVLFGNPLYTSENTYLTNSSYQNAANYGLINLDSITYHINAINLYEQMKKFGIQNWSFKFQGNFATSITSLVYYFTSPNPINLLPLNSLIHSVSSCILFLILRNFFTSKVSSLSVFIFILNPQTLEWSSQNLKEGYFILGIFLFVLYMIKILHYSQNTNFTIKKNLFLLCILVSSFSIIWVTRPYFLYFLLIFNIFIMLYQLIKIKTNLASISYLFYLLIIVALNMHITINEKRTSIKNVFNAHIADISVDSDDKQAKTLLVQNKKKASAKECKKLNASLPSNCFSYWENTKYVPVIIESFLYKISYNRFKAISYAGNSLYSTKNFSSISELIPLLPVSLFYGVFSPLPDLWYGEGSNPAMTIARNIMGLFTFLLYFPLLMVSIKTLFNVKNIPLIFLITFCVIGCTFIALLYPNVGTMLRWRFSFYIILISIGISYILDIVLKKIK